MSLVHIKNSTLSTGISNASLLMPVSSSDNGSLLMVVVQFIGGNHTYVVYSSNITFNYYSTFYCKHPWR